MTTKAVPKPPKNSPDEAAKRPRKQRRNAVLEKPAPPTTKRGIATRDRLKAALVALLQDRPFHEIRLEDIARHAGVRVSLIYHYFRSKTDITYEVLDDMLTTFQAEVSTRSRGDDPIEAIHFANLRMIALYAGNPGAMRCLLETHEDLAEFSRMWRELTLDWNRRIAASLARQFPKASASSAEYLALAYALAGTVDNFLYEYYVLGNPALHKAYGSEEEVARFLTTIWYRALYLKNPTAGFLPGTGFKGL